MFSFYLFFLFLEPKPDKGQICSIQVHMNESRIIVVEGLLLLGCKGRKIRSRVGIFLSLQNAPLRRIRIPLFSV